jgi:hypothetical protein
MVPQSATVLHFWTTFLSKKLKDKTKGNNYCSQPDGTNKVQSLYLLQGTAEP